MATTRVQLPDGNIGEFPATMKPEDIQAVLAKQFPPPPPPDERNGLQKVFDESTAPATPEERAGSPNWLNEAADVPRGFINGMGSLVAHPIQSAEGIGRAFMHPMDTAESAGKAFDEHPGYTVGQTLGGLGAGAAVGGAMAKIPEIADAIPTRAKAGAMFQDVMAKAGDQPVWMQNSGAELNRALELADRGGTKPTTVSKLARRVGNVNNSPMNYSEARDFATNLSDLSADEKMALKPVMRRQVGKLSRAFNQDVGDAASRAGVGDQYVQAMRDYARASQFRNAATTAAKWAVPVAVGGGIASKLARTLIPDR
jgi:hypothetical protein